MIFSQHVLFINTGSGKDLLQILLLINNEELNFTK